MLPVRNANPVWRSFIRAQENANGFGELLAVDRVDQQRSWFDLALLKRSSLNRQVLAQSVTERAARHPRARCFGWRTTRTGGRLGAERDGANGAQDSCVDRPSYDTAHGFLPFELPGTRGLAIRAGEDDGVTIGIAEPDLPMVGTAVPLRRVAMRWFDDFRLQLRRTSDRVVKIIDFKPEQDAIAVGL